MGTRRQNKRLLRRMDFLISETYLPNGVDWNHIYSRGCVAIITGVSQQDCLTSPYKVKNRLNKKHIDLLVQIIVLGIELGMSSDEIKIRCYKKWDKKVFNNKREPKKEGRDNKGIYVGNGGSNRNKIRYPKLNKSKRVWKIFYNMFPRAAETDNWNGEKSDRYPRKK